MPREPRIYIEKVLYLVTAKSLDDRELFLDPQDYTEYMKSLSELKSELGFKLFSYCLLPKSLTMLIELRNKVTISTIMHHLNSNYTKKYNSRYGKKGHLFQSRFKSILVEKDPYLLKLTRYVHLLPKEEGIINNVASYPFSSYFTYTYEDHQSHSGMQWPNIIEEIREVISYASTSPMNNDQTQGYCTYMTSAKDGELESVRKLLHRKSYVGSDTFIKSVRHKVDDHIKKEKEAQVILKINPGYVVAGSLIILFLTTVSYTFYNNQTQLQTSLDVATSGFEIAREDLANRVFTMKSEISRFEEKENHGLGGFAWELKLTPIQQEKKHQAYIDKLQFKGGQVISTKLMAKGYLPFDYTISQKAPGKMIWETTQTNIDGTTVRWYGVIAGDNMRGVLTESPVEGNNRDFSFVSVRRVNNLGRNKNVVQ